MTKKQISCRGNIGKNDKLVNFLSQTDTLISKKSERYRLAGAAIRMTAWQQVYYKVMVGMASTVFHALSKYGQLISNFIYDVFHTVFPFLGRRSDEEYFAKPPYWIFAYTVFFYGICFLIAFVGDVLRFFGILKAFTHQEHPKHKDFVKLYDDFKAYYTKNMYGWVRDCWNRPTSSLPCATFSIVDRISYDYGWTFEFPGTTTTAINLGSYNYLGFAQNSGPCAENAAKSIEKFGLGLCSSRNEFGTHVIHRRLEKLTAEFLGVEDAICFPMGFATNSMNLPSIVSKGCLVLSDELNHSSLILGCRLSGATIKIFKHNDTKDLEAKLRDSIIYGQPKTGRPFEKILICVEGIYSMEGSIANLPEIIALKKKYKAYLYLDEAHSMGSLGPNGRGLCDYFNCNPREVDILMGTFSKSFAAVGGYIAGRKELIDHLKAFSQNSCYGSTMSPPVAQQIITAMNILMGRDGTNKGAMQIKQLARNTAYFRRRLKQMGFIVHGHEMAPIMSLMIYDPLKLITFSREMLRHKVAVVAAGFPATQLILARIRFCISATHSKEILDQALQAIDIVGDQLGAKFIKKNSKHNEVVHY